MGSQVTISEIDGVETTNSPENTGWWDNRANTINSESKDSERHQENRKTPEIWATKNQLVAAAVHVSQKLKTEIFLVFTA